jgi:hypothetical protein
MTIMTHAHAEHELTRVAARFADWRHRRATSSAPIPSSLWEQAVSLTTVLSISRVAQGIGVSWGTLKKRCVTHHPTPAAEEPSTPHSVCPSAFGFVEVPTSSVWPPTLGMEIELQRPDGTRLRMHSHEPQPPLVALVRTFLETTGCSS